MEYYNVKGRAARFYSADCIAELRVKKSNNATAHETDDVDGLTRPESDGKEVM